MGMGLEGGLTFALESAVSMTTGWRNLGLHVDVVESDGRGAVGGRNEQREHKIPGLQGWHGSGLRRGLFMLAAKAVFVHTT